MKTVTTVVIKLRAYIWTGNLIYSMGLMYLTEQTKNSSLFIRDVMSVGLDVCACVSNFFQIAISPTIFLRFLRHLAHVISVPLCNKTVEQFFKILLLQIFREFLFFIFFFANR